MRRLVLPSLLVLATALPSAAEDDRSLWSLLHPDRIMGQVLRSLVLGARSQMDLRYSDLTVSLVEGVISADDLELTLYENLTGGDPCDMRLAGLELLTGDPFSLDRIDIAVAARSVELEESCVPREARPALAVLGQKVLFVPEVTVTLTYDLPTGAAGLALAAAVTDVAALRVDVDMDYLTIWAGDGDDGEVSGDLRAASVVLEDLGGWARVAPLLPPDFTDPATAGAAAAQLIGQAFEREAAGGIVPKPAKTFAADAAQAWADFVASPGRLVLETGFDPSAPVFLDADQVEDGVFAVIETLQPVLTRAPAAERRALAPALIARALTSPDSLSAEDRRVVGLALLTGRGAPLAATRGSDLLAPLMESGDGAVSVAMARALAVADPVAAYAAALAAGGTGVPGVRPLLDRLERDLPFATRLRLQREANPEVTDADLRASPRELAARAEAHLAGTTAPRSLDRALLYASLAAARGHAGAARLLDRIDRQIPDEGRAEWAVVADEVADRALTAWIEGMAPPAAPR